MFEELSTLFAQDRVHKATVRTTKVYTSLYGFTDDSCSGFGSTYLTTEGICFSIETWKNDVEGNSSNWKDFENIIEALKCEKREGRLTGAMSFLATTNVIRSVPR